MNRWPFDWPKSRADAGNTSVRAKVGELMAQHRAAWRPHRCVMNLLADHYPLVWSKNEWTDRDGVMHGDGVRWCRTEPDDASRRKEDELEVAKVRSCGLTPFCPACNDERARKRGAKLLSKIVNATPDGEPVTAYLVTAAVTEMGETGAAIVNAARRDWRAFREASRALLERMYGENVGAWITYQDYGQRLLIKPRVHVHALVHTWREQDGKLRSIKRFQLKDGGRDRLHAIWFEELQRAFPNVSGERPEDWLGPTDVNIQWRDHPGKVAKSAKYVMRELIDFRELRYDRTTQLVTVHPYKREEQLGGPAVAHVDEVKRNFVDYAARCGAWGRRGTDPLHAAYGCVANNRINDFTTKWGRGEEHPEGCRCHECSTWERYWEDAPTGAPLGAPLPSSTEA